MREKKNQFCYIAYSFFELLEKLLYANIIFFEIYVSFCKIYVFTLGVFSIFNFNLRNLKGNGNAATEKTFCKNILL